MKKVLSLLLSLLLLVGLLAACANDQGQEEGQQNQETQEGTEGQDAQTPDTTEETTTIRLGGLKGPTSMGMVKLLDDAERLSLIHISRILSGNHACRPALLLLLAAWRLCGL